MMLFQTLSWLGWLFIVIVLGSIIYLGRFLYKSGDQRYIEKLREHKLLQKKVESELENNNSEIGVQSTVRDFVYIDADRLYSLYSQVFEGVAERIVQSYVGLSSSKDTVSQSKKPTSIEAQVAEATLHTESKVLYDHMYNILEKKLGDRIIETEEVTLENYSEKIRNVSLIRVHGTADIEDYKRMGEFIGKFNEIADAIAYSTVTSNSETAQLLKEGEEAIRNTPDPNRRALARAKFESVKDIKKIAREMGLRQDEQSLKNLLLFSGFFYGDGFDITISPTVSSDVVYRGVLDRRWLRIQPDLLRALFGASTKDSWVMVGQATLIPELENTTETESEKEDIVADGDPSMRDPFRNMFTSSRVFETMFQRSKKRIEIIIAPLAIYREIEITN